jgi:predicted membrane channel-forming protein YqfA (hemolysin III family)
MTLSKIIAAINTNIVNPLIFLLLAVALVVFIWGVVSYFRNIDNADERKIGIRHMIWGVIGLAIMISFKGIIAIIKNLIGV